MEQFAPIDERAAQRKTQGRPVDLRETTISLINPFTPMA